MEFSVKPNVLRSNGTQIASISRGITAASWAVQSAAFGLDTSMRAYATIARKLDGYAQELEGMSRRATRLKKCAVKVASLYEQADGATVNRNKIRKEHFKDFVKDFIFEGLETFGPIGGAIGISRAVWDGEYEKIPGKIYDIYDQVHENMDGSKVKWKDVFGLNKIDDPLDYSIGNAKEALTSKANWAFELLESGVDNYKEHGGFTARWAEETGVEAGISIGETALVGIGVGALVAAAGVTAPAWAIGAAAAAGVVVADAGINAVVRWATGNPKADWKESVSDFVCDRFEEYQSFKSGVHKAIGKSVKKGFNKLVSAFKSKGSSCRWGLFSR